MPLGQRVVLIGGGHNALITAFYLAKGGFKPLVLERREMVGGGAITEEFHPGFKASTLAHTLGPLRVEIARDMQIEKFQCEILYPGPRVFAPTPGGNALLFWNDNARTARGIASISAKDSAKYMEFADSLDHLTGVLDQLVSITPPAIDKPTPEDLWNLFKTGRNVRMLRKKGIFDLLRWAPMAVADFVAEFFETELIRAVIAARGIFGTALGPWSAGSTAVLLMRAAGDTHPVGTAAFPRGGLGNFTRALAESAKQAGAEIRTDAEVQQIRLKDGSVAGVVLTTGEEIAVEAVVSGVDPKRTFFHLLDPSQLDPTFANRIKNFRANGTVAKVNVALGGLPTFTALDPAEGFLEALSGRIHIGPKSITSSAPSTLPSTANFQRRPTLTSPFPRFSILLSLLKASTSSPPACSSRHLNSGMGAGIRAAEVLPKRFCALSPLMRPICRAWWRAFRSSRPRISRPPTASPAVTSFTANSPWTSFSPCVRFSIGRATRRLYAVFFSAARARIPATA